MAFDRNALERVFRGRSRSLWLYTTPDTKLYEDARYWDAAAPTLRIGDRIMLASGYGEGIASCDGDAVVHGKGTANGEPWVQMVYLPMIEQ